MKLDNLDQDVEGVHALHVHVEYVDKFLRDEQKPQDRRKRKNSVS